MLISKINKNLILFTLIGIALYVALTIYADIDSVLNSITNFPVEFILLLLLLSFFNYVTRFYKWHFYLQQLRIQIHIKDSFLIFLSGFVMSVTPGKFGEVLKSLILKKHFNYQISKTAPIIIVERITDLISLVVIAAIGSLSFNIGGLVLILTSSFLILIIFVLVHRRLFEYLIHKFAKVKFIKKFLEQFVNIHESFWSLLTIKNILLMSMLSIVAWFFECLSFYLILSKFDSLISINLSSFIYAFSTIVGSMLLLPGGLGGTEGTMTLLLIKYNFSKEAAVISTMLIRIVTLWFAVFVGFASFILYQKINGKIYIEINSENMKN